MADTQISIIEELNTVYDDDFTFIYFTLKILWLSEFFYTNREFIYSFTRRLFYSISKKNLNKTNKSNSSINVKSIYLILLDTCIVRNQQVLLISYASIRFLLQSLFIGVFWPLCAFCFYTFTVLVSVRTFSSLLLTLNQSFCQWFSFFLLLLFLLLSVNICIRYYYAGLCQFSLRVSSRRCLKMHLKQSKHCSSCFPLLRLKLANMSCSQT